MKKILGALSLLCMYSIQAQVKPAPVKVTSPLTLWYTKPAGIWEEALPLGNAKTGAMVFGGVTTERYQLNDNTLWSAAPNPGNNPNGPVILPQVRAQVEQGNYDSARALWRKMQGPYSARYLPLADLWVKSAMKDTIPSYYYRSLDLQNATSLVKYTVGNITYTRETFISHPAKIMMVRITANKKASINIQTTLTSKLKYHVNAVSDNYLVLKGKAPKYVANREYDPHQVVYDENANGEGMNFEVHVKLLAVNGTVNMQVR